MWGRKKRQSWRMTSRELHRLTRPALKWVKEVWVAANDVASQDELFSPLAGAVGEGLADGESTALIVIRIGYGTRAVLAGPTEQPSQERSWFGLSHAEAAVGELVGTVQRRASEDFSEVMTLPDEVWAAYVANATRELQGRFGTIPRETIEQQLRCGYVLCCLDEALG